MIPCLGLSLPQDLQSSEYLFHPSPVSPLRRHRLNQLNGRAAQTQFRLNVSPAELSGSAPVTPALTSSFSLMWTRGGRLWCFAANPGSGTASLNTCTKRYDSGQSPGGGGVADSQSHNFLLLFSLVHDNLFVRIAALLNYS